MSGIILAAPQSGSGKTTLTLALLRALRRGGTLVISAKVGPDYIDPAFHTAASGAPCLNLDSWAMRPALVARLARQLESADALVLCEGAMGLYDGVGASEAGSTAELAARLGWPVVLVVDAARQGASVAALLEGFTRHRSDVAFAGVIFNRVGSARHAAILAAAIRTTLPELAILGSVPRDVRLALPERHLGLVQAGEHCDLDGFLDRAAEIVSGACDLPRMISLGRPTQISDMAETTVLQPFGQRIAVARDTAFAFAYLFLLNGWHEAGAELSFFSPLADEAPDASANAIYLPGGYPELHGGRLAGNRRFLEGLRRCAGDGIPIYGECGGYMALGDGLIDGAGARHQMAGLLPVTTSFAEARLHLGYREMTSAQTTILGRSGTVFRGHEFHYASTVVAAGAPPLFTVRDGEGADLGTSGMARGSVSGSFLHLIDRGI